MNARPHTEPAPLCPIPRSGLRGTPGIILHILVAIAAALMGIGICAMGTTSQTQIDIAQAVSAVAILLLVVYLWRVTRTVKGIVPILIFLGIFLTYRTSSILPAAVLCGLIFAVSQGSVLLALQPNDKLLWFPIIPIVAYAATLVVSGDPVGSATVLVPFPPMIVLAWGTRNSAEKQDGLTRVGVICATSLAMGLSVGIMALVGVYRHLGTLDPAVLMDALEAFRTALIDEIASTEIPTEGLNEEAIEEIKSMLSYANVTNAVNSVFNLLPAVAIVVINLTSTAVQLIQHGTLRAFGFEDSITDRVRAFRMSLISCVVFLVAYLIAFLEAFMEGSAVSSLTGTVAQNIYIILLPGLAFAGMLRLIRRLARKGPQGMGCLFFFVILIPCLFLFAPFLFAAIEVIGHIFRSITDSIKPPSDDDDLFGSGK